MTDQILHAIESGLLNANDISFDKLRAISGRDSGVWKELGRGRSILRSTEQLDQYLYSYGPMTRNQWHEVLAPLSFNPEPVQVVDYGCGQGLATALLIDRFGKDLIRSLRKVILVEPSQVALTRAAAIVSCYANHIDVITLEKRLEALEPSELKASTGVLSIHLFSNVLDIEGYDHFGLLAKIFQSKGRHFIMAVSHDRDFDGGSTRFRDLEEAVSRPEYQSWFSVQYSSIRQFSCNGGQSAIAWLLEVEVLNGSL